MILLDLALCFGLLSLVAFGGLPPVLPELQHHVVDVRGWASAAEFTQLFAIAQAAPGPNILFAGLLGWKVAGIGGALVALAAICAPPAVIAWHVAGLWERYRDADWRVALQRSMAPLVAGLVFSGGVVLATPGNAIDWRLWLIAALSAAFMLATRLNPLWLLAGGGVIGGLLL